MLRHLGWSVGTRIALFLLATMTGWLVFLLYEVGLGSLLEAVNDVF
jgi:hypothetical protein